MRKNLIAAIILIVLSFAVSAYFYPAMPQQIASHWNAAGQANGYMPKFWGAFLIPLISFIIFLVLFFIPKIDPLRKNIEKFQAHYDRLLLLFVLFMFYLHLLTLSWNLGYRFNMSQLLTPAFGILFYGIGQVMENTKRNWFIGIRTPWTLSSDENWEKTHKIGGTLFKLSGIIALIGVFFYKYAIFFMIVPVILSSIYTVIYSYVYYKKEKK